MCRAVTSFSIKSPQAQEDHLFIHENESESVHFTHIQQINEWEDFIMFTVAVILFCTGAVIAVINAYCLGTRCMRVGSNRDYAHFSPCTFY